MMSLHELRIGNYVLVDENVRQVSLIRNTTVSTIDTQTNNEVVSEHSFQRIQPVPLTNSILQQLGFVYHEYFKFWQLITTGIRSEMNISPDYEVIDLKRKPALEKLTSLHQLQNIYFLLKGRELKFSEKVLLKK
jgi:hypothetical protein